MCRQISQNTMLRSLGYFLKGNGKPRKALSRGAMVRFLGEKVFCSSIRLSKLDGDKSGGRQEWGQTDRQGYYCGDLRGPGGRVGEYGMGECAWEEDTLTWRRVLGMGVCF